MFCQELQCKMPTTDGEDVAYHEELLVLKVAPPQHSLISVLMQVQDKQVGSQKKHITA